MHDLQTRLSEVIAPAFHDLHRDLKQHAHTHYWLAGGRGSGKSSFTSIEILLGMMRHPDRNGIAFRKYGSYLRDSVFAQSLWALDRLGVAHLWVAQKSPLQLIYKPTGQRVLFRGLDDPLKSKSIKVERGYFAYIWYEEAAELDSMDDVETVNASLMRGGNDFWIFYSYNPPRSKNAWVNAEAVIPYSDKLLHRSTYEQMPSSWLGEPFIAEAERVRKVNPDKWRWMYGGEATGTGGEVFRNLTLRVITDTEIATFDHPRRGLDWGYAADPFAYLVGDYDRKHRRLHVYYERYALNVSNQQAAAWVKAENVRNGIVYCDSSEPKSIAFLQGEGINALPCRKYAGSREEGYAFMSDDVEEIVIDPARCPNAAREFTAYELERDTHGNFKGKYPDHDDHTIDAVHYMLDDDITHKFVPIAGRHRLF